ncbi:family 5 extracellular solute-binding protein [Natrialba aegyptia DSM 13077]|uniref:Family 5 extracellular solute-binding protein n=1 Tax=Natrialba aegyptia DSM 13077 TaxID=1227491 RepID=M0AIH2_9EURY|nr:family 5 extracellular solute-binding protein [Natrialba aegyptia DSM 13077]
MDSAEEFLTRRQMLAASSAMVAAGVAGCMGGEKEGRGEGGISSWQPTIPDEINFNSWATGYPWSQSWMLLEPVQRFYADGSMTLEQISDWEYDPDEQAVTVEFEEGWYWWNGDQVTAEDKYWYEECARLFQGDGSDIEELILEDEMTLTRVYKEPQNPELVQYQLGGYLGEMQRVHRDKFKPWAEELQDAADHDERLEIQEEMAEEMPLHISTVMDEGLGNGPFEIVDYDTEGIYCELFEDHPYADEIEIDEFEFVLAQDDALAQRIQGGVVDFGFGLLQQWVGEGTAPNSMDNITVYNDTFMRKLEFFGQGPGAEHLRRREVRRAIAHVLNLEHISTNYNTESVPREAQTGLPSAVTENWLDDSYVESYIDYPVQDDEERATELMEQAGYELRGDEWVDEDGDLVSLQLVLPDFRTNLARTISDQLINFGFEIDFNVLESATYNDRKSNNVDFDLTIENHGGQIAHPFYYFRHNHTAGNELGETVDIEQALDAGETRSPYNGREIVVEVPTEVGQEDLSGSTEEVNLFELDQEWRSVNDEQRNQEIAETFSWYWNFHLPGVNLVEVQTGTFGNTQDYDFNTETNDWEAYRGAYRGLKRGHISPSD